MIKRIKQLSFEEHLYIYILRLKALNVDNFSHRNISKWVQKWLTKTYPWAHNGQKGRQLCDLTILFPWGSWLLMNNVIWVANYCFTVACEYKALKMIKFKKVSKIWTMFYYSNSVLRNAKNEQCLNMFIWSTFILLWHSKATGLCLYFFIADEELQEMEQHYNTPKKEPDRKDIKILWYNMQFWLLHIGSCGS